MTAKLKLAEPELGVDNVHTLVAPFEIEYSRYVVFGFKTMFTPIKPRFFDTLRQAQKFAATLDHVYHIYELVQSNEIPS